MNGHSLDVDKLTNEWAHWSLVDAYMRTVT